MLAEGRSKNGISTFDILFGFRLDGLNARTFVDEDTNLVVVLELAMMSFVYQCHLLKCKPMRNYSLSNDVNECERLD